MIYAAVEDSVIAMGNRFGLHDLKRKGTTERGGARGKKQEASGHKSAQMMEIYDLRMPLVDPTQAV